MKLVLSLLILLSGTLAASGFERSPFNYHEKYGIPKAARIKAAEEASDFDGARITGGSAASLGQFPYMGGLLVHMVTGQVSVCGSSLLTNTRLVTAAHCWFDGSQNANMFTVVLGSILVFSGGTRISTNQVVVHPQFNIFTVVNDIAIITISHVTFTNTISPIGLPTGSASYVGQTAVAAGFGLTADSAGISPNQFLSFVNLPVITNAQCESVFGFLVRDSNICTWGPPGQNVCNSDSGGPLVIGNELIGVTSFGARCGTDAPAAFVRVTSFLPWIHQHL